MFQNQSLSPLEGALSCKKKTSCRPHAAIVFASYHAAGDNHLRSSCTLWLFFFPKSEATMECCPSKRLSCWNVAKKKKGGDSSKVVQGPFKNNKTNPPR